MLIPRWLPIGGLAAAMTMLSACGGGPAAQPTAAASVGPTLVPTVGRVASPSVALSPSPAPPAAATAEVASPTTVWVGNTDGEGVYLRKAPAMADRLQAYPDGTPLTVVGADTVGDGQQWKHVRTPDGVEGYVPTRYTVDVQP